MEWIERAACRDMPVDMFMPHGKGQEAIKHTAEAKAVCRGCPVKWECLQYAVDNFERIGIYGGISFSVKSSMRQARTLLAHHDAGRTISLP